MQNPSEPKKPDDVLKKTIRNLIRHSIDMFVEGIWAGMEIGRMETPKEQEKPVQNQANSQQVTMSAEEFSEKIIQSRDAGFKAGWEALATSIRNGSLN